ncbi:hypothetical protein [Leadbetterella byssophila]|uniref:hypothetical protein n=1 Tax=Leadbetterella byssophila TaxID=316068 RepID=UPI0039A2BBB7
MQVVKLKEMGVKVVTNIDKLIAGAKAKALEAIEGKIIEAFRLALMDAVGYAKQSSREGSIKRYKDQTGALSSSTGFNLYRSGELVHSYFQGEGGDGSGHGSGVSTGQRVAEEESSDLRERWICGVMVAGMHYAAAVEAKGYDVLTAAEFKLPEFLEGRLKAVFGNSEAFSITRTNEY